MVFYFMKMEVDPADVSFTDRRVKTFSPLEVCPLLQSLTDRFEIGFGMSTRLSSGWGETVLPDPQIFPLNQLTENHQAKGVEVCIDNRVTSSRVGMKPGTGVVVIYSRHHESCFQPIYLAIVSTSFSCPDSLAL